ncbi:GNAT family N-acetyltransferase [Streptomyces rectiverticillatus]|uniref:GNAT family N-acetyltransferase n=1 Tax=Streptomyces rectiverticillatus TaxID=173860 RepID=UPI001FE83A11|nr:GNAT family N-acetyltransferase [Streptomyces rectiverticillatus]
MGHVGRMDRIGSMGHLRIVTMAEPELPPELRTQIEALQEQAWPGGGPHDPALRPVAVLLLAPDGGVRAALDILSKEIIHEGRSYRASGLSAVVTDAAHRGKRYGRRLVAAARELIADGGAVDVGLFTCDSPLQGFYESAGWTALPGTVLIGGTPQDPFPSDQPGFDKVTMAAFFTARAQRDAAAFERSRIGLYPGDVDRLW